MEERIILAGSAGKRIDIALAEYLGVSRSRVQRLISEGYVLVDGSTTSRHHRLSGEEVISLLPRPEKEYALMPQEIPLKVIYEDEDILVLSKQAGLVVHPAAGHPDGTLVNALLHAIPDLGEIEGEVRPGIIHRLDRDTSGLMVVAKNERSLHILQKMVRERGVKRWYLTLVHGIPPTSAGTIEAPIGRDPKDRKRMAVIEQGKPAITNFHVIETLDRFSLLEVELVTGRTHQIRVHLAYIGYPVAGDQVYGRRSGETPLNLSRQFLHAHHLLFSHPMTGEMMDFYDPLPPDLQSVLGKLRGEK